MKLKTSPVTSSDAPSTSTVARRGSVRRRNPRATSDATSSTSAVGSNQVICVANSEPNSRVMPVDPHEPAPVVPPGTTLPVSSPVTRPRPL